MAFTSYGQVSLFSTEAYLQEPLLNYLTLEDRGIILLSNLWH